MPARKLRQPDESPPESAVLWDVAGEHFDEVEFLLGACQAAMTTASYTAAELNETLVRRLDAHLDALILSGEAVIERLLDPTIEEEETPERVMAAALVGLELPSADLVITLFEKALKSPTLAEGLISAAGWTRRLDLAEALAALRERPEFHGLVLRIAALVGLPPGPELELGMSSKSRPLQAAALTALRMAENGRDHLAWVESQIDAPNARVALLAMDTALAWRSQTAWQILRKRAAMGEPAAVSRLMALGSRRDCFQLVEDWGPKAWLFGLGFSGWPQAAEVCLEFLNSQDLTVARLAGEAFVAVTGLPQNENQYWLKEPPDDDEVPPLEADLATDLMPPPEASLRLPRAEVFEAWWAKAQPLFDPDTRYIMGRPVDFDTLQWAFRDAVSLRRVHQLSMLVGIRTGTVWLPTQSSPACFLDRMKTARVDKDLSFQHELPHARLALRR